MRCALNTLTVLALGQLTNAAQPSDKSAANKRALHVIDTIFSYEGIQGDCAALPPSQGPHIEPDTPEAFAASEIWSVWLPCFYIELVLIFIGPCKESEDPKGL